MIDLETNEVIRTFYSLSEAGNFLNKGKGGAAHISQACSGKRKLLMDISGSGKLLRL